MNFKSFLWTWLKIIVAIVTGVIGIYIIVNIPPWAFMIAGFLVMTGILAYGIS